MSNTQTDVEALDQEVSEVGQAVGDLTTHLNTAEQQIADLQASADPHIKQQVADLAVTIQKAKDALTGIPSTGGTGGTTGGTGSGGTESGGSTGGTGATSALPLYTHDGPVTDSDKTAWPATNLQTPDGQPLFNFAKDTAGQPPTGDGAGGVWHLYTGPTQPATGSTGETPQP